MTGAAGGKARRLTDEQRAWVAASLGVAYAVADRHRPGGLRDREDVAQEAAWALCFAAAGPTATRGPSARSCDLALFATVCADRRLRRLRRMSRPLGYRASRGPAPAVLPIGDLPLASRHRPASADVDARDLVRHLTRRLPARERDAVAAYYFEGLDTRAIAARWGRTHQLVSVYLARALARMRAAETPTPKGA